MKKLLASFLIFHLCAFGDNGYDEDFVDLIEIVYGEGYLSQGGSEKVEQMFCGTDLTGKKILDLGCGIGGPALYLAKNYDLTVVGVDPEEMMIQKCKKALDQLDSSWKGEASFALMEDPLTLKQFPDNSFDIVMSREAILHVPHADKVTYFREIYRVLKDGGELVVVDWQHSSSCYSDAVREMMEMDGVPFCLTTQEEYVQTVAEAGFCDVTLEDWTAITAAQTWDDLTIIEANREQIVQRFDEETYDYAYLSWGIQAQAFEDRELLVGLIKGVKRQL